MAVSLIFDSFGIKDCTKVTESAGLSSAVSYEEVNTAMIYKDESLLLEDENGIPDFRWIEEEDNSTGTNSTDADESNEYHESGVLRDTFILYGSLLLVVWLLFCWVRLKFPRPFTIRQWSTKPSLKVGLVYI
jgi:hypothetical protein